MPVELALATGDDGEVVLIQAIPGETAQAVALALGLLLLLDVAGIILAKVGKCECNAKTRALAPTATTTTPIVTIRATFVILMVAPFEEVPIL